MHRIVVATAGMLLSAGALAGGYHHGYGIDYRSGYGHHGYGHHRGARHHRGYRHGRHGEKYGYLAAGLLVGALLHDLADRRRHQPVRSSRSHRRVGSLPAVEQVPASEFDRYYRVEPDGSCWLIERTPEGEFIASEEDPAVCR